MCPSRPNLVYSKAAEAAAPQLEVMSLDADAEDELARLLGQPSEAPVADASVTSTPGVVLAILTADCLPVVFAADDGREVAAAHAGWRGLAAGVLEATVASMRTPADRIVAWLGPAAGPQAYEIGEEVYRAFVERAFVDRDPQAEAAFAATRPGHWRVDLYALARLRLAQAGVSRVHGGGLCTISDPARFYSHRRSTSDGSGRTGRMATLAAGRAGCLTAHPAGGGDPALAVQRHPPLHLPAAAAGAG